MLLPNRNLAILSPTGCEGQVVAYVRSQEGMLVELCSPPIVG